MADNEDEYLTQIAKKLLFYERTDYSTRSTDEAAAWLLSRHWLGLPEGTTPSDIIRRAETVARRQKSENP
jgi:hypothetical protein